MRIDGVGEKELIKKISSGLNYAAVKDIVRGIGDDTAVTNFDKKNYLLLTTDSQVDGTHFKEKWMSMEEIGMKAVEVNVSDIAAMGGTPAHLLISLGLPKSMDSKDFDKLMQGIKKSSKKHGVTILGGNVSESKQLFIDGTMTGFVEKEKLCLRKGAKTNDLILVTGTLGKSAAGLELLKKGREGKSIKYYKQPKARLDIAKKLAGKVSSMIDVSDGLASDVKNVCEQNKKGAVIYKKKIPISKATVEDAKKSGRDPYNLALHGGEDFELLFTIHEEDLNKVKNLVKCSVIGRVLPKSNGMKLKEKDKTIRLGEGYEHFKNSSNP